MNALLRILTLLLAITVSVGTMPSAADVFLRGVYWPQERAQYFAEKAGMDPWELADEQLGLLKEHNCNLIWTVNTNVEQLRRLCEIAASHDIAVVGCPESVHWWRQHRTPEVALARNRTEMFRDVPEVILPHDPAEYDHAYYLYNILVPHE